MEGLRGRPARRMSRAAQGTRTARPSSAALRWRSGSAHAPLFLLLACGGPDEVNAPRAEAPEPRPAHVTAVSSVLPPDDVLQALRGREYEVESCFDRGEGRGLVRLGWAVGPDGAARDVRVERSTVGNGGVEACLAKFVEKLRFELQEAPAQASWTFVRGVGDEGVLERAARRSKRRGNASERNQGVVVDEASPGRLAVSAIENVAEHGFRLYAFCMREGLNRNIRLNGRVMLQFTIGSDGRVEGIRDAGSDLPDLEVIDCVAEAFYALKFPEPEGGAVRLRYSILLNEKEL